MSKFSYEKRGDVAIISFNDPETLNAITHAMAMELVDLLARAESEVRCTLLTGKGRGFCSGANISAGPQQAADGQEVDLGAELENAFNPLILAMADHNLPIVTAINGAAAGIGSSIGLMGDIILASENAYFLQAFINIGLVPDGGATLLLPQAVGRARAMELAMLGERLPAAKALEWGLINRMTPAEALNKEALIIADRLASGPTRALARTRKLIWRGTGAGLADQLQAERAAQSFIGQTKDFARGVSSFYSKSKATFKGD